VIGDGIGDRRSAIARSAIGDRRSAIGNRRSAIVRSAMGDRRHRNRAIGYRAIG
jgi:hypothetical protein